MYKEENIIGTIRKLKREYDEEVILSVKGYAFTQRKLIDLIEKYWDSKFISGDKERGGLYRFFNNIIKFPTRIAMKMTDFDTKDFRFFAEEGQSHAPVYLFNKELKAWMKDEDFGYILNRIIKNTPKYGNHLIKTIGDDTSTVRLKNIVCDPYVEFLEQSYLVVEEHYMTPKDVMDMDGKWDKKSIDYLMDCFEKTTESTIRVDECYIYGYKSEFGEIEKDTEDKFVRGRVFVAGLDDYKTDNKGRVTKSGHYILHKDIPPKSLPYYEFFWDDFQGTYLRTGVVLELLEEQFNANDVSHIERKGLYWTSKRIYQTKDMLVAKNIMLDVEDGDILRVQSEITAVNHSEKNLPAFNNVYEQIDKNRREKTMTFESVSGESLPSGTPFRLGFVQSKAAGGYFDFQREDIGLLLKKFIVDIIVPAFKNSKRTKHIFNLYGEDNELSKMEDFMIEGMMYKAIQANFEKTGIVPSEEELMRERDNVKQKLRAAPNRKIEIPEAFYDDLKYKMDLLLTDESMALDAKSTTLTTALQTIATNPAILQNPVTKRIFLRLVELGGVSPEEIQSAMSEMSGQSIMNNPMLVNPNQTFSPPPGPVRTAELSVGNQQMQI